MDFALGAVMATTREALAKAGGFTPLLDYLADDYQLGNRIAHAGGAVTLSPLVVECRSSEANWHQVSNHQLRWARTIRACQPVPFFLSILSNPTLWPALWFIANPSLRVGLMVLGLLLFRGIGGAWLESRLTKQPFQLGSLLVAPISDVFRAVFWALSFLGNRVHWGGRPFRVSRGGKLAPLP